MIGGDESLLFVSVIAVFNKKGDRLLLCKRSKDPYKDLFDFVGGKAEANEDALACAYRELFEETGITHSDISLKPIMDFAYHASSVTISVFYGCLNADVPLVEEINPLVWTDLDHDFCDKAVYAGEGYIAHVLEQIALFKSR
jgi:8-oxo-dGTP diphosphatase